MKEYCKSSDGSITYTTDGNFIYAEKDGISIRLDLFDRHYYKLRLYNNVPILEIDGIRMQLVKDFKTPLDYSKAVVKGLQIPKNANASLLDTCMGLGYTAIEASRQKGVKLVTTCEISDAVFTLAKWNPLSETLWNKNIVPMKGDVVEIIKNFDSSMFSFIIHDPPRFSHAPQLYSLEFYKELKRICKKQARIFNYVGSVGKKKGRNIEKEVEKKLSVAGFKNIKYVKKLQGIFATLP
ncbi:SAM-dependent methyltransferase [Candidatus Micrarchaeota archaeon]|nr:SAM-dependent methyltransferase [Candidatus Micrarchaeota archaeon]